MLKTEDFTRTFDIVTKTDRDGEMPLLLEFLKNKAPIESLLDCGAHYSSHHYANEVRKLVKRYDGIDILPDPETEKIVDNYYVGNANEYPLDKYDVVICVSTVEHSGTSTYKGNPQEEQEKLFMKCLELTKKYLWISFPTGLPYVYPNELSVITKKQLKRWETLTSNFKVKERFLHNSAGPQAGTPWREHSKREAATLQQYWDYCGNQAITILEIEK